MLVDHADAMRDRIAGRSESDRHTVDLDLAAIRSVEPGQDAHQRRLAGAVLPNQGVNLAPGGLEIDLIVGHHRSEPLTDGAHGDRGAGSVG